MYSKKRDKDLNVSKKSISSMKSFGSQGKIGGPVPFVKFCFYSKRVNYPTFEGIVRIPSCERREILTHRVIIWNTHQDLWIIM